VVHARDRRGVRSKRTRVQKNQPASDRGCRAETNDGGRSGGKSMHLSGYGANDSVRDRAGSRARGLARNISRLCWGCRPGGTSWRGAKLLRHVIVPEDNGCRMHCSCAASIVEIIATSIRIPVSFAEVSTGGDQIHQKHPQRAGNLACLV